MRRGSGIGAGSGSVVGGVRGKSASQLPATHGPVRRSRKGSASWSGAKVLGRGVGSGGRRVEPESLILAQNERWRQA